MREELDPGARGTQPETVPQNAPNEAQGKADPEVRGTQPERMPPKAPMEAQGKADPGLRGTQSERVPQNDPNEAQGKAAPGAHMTQPERIPQNPNEAQGKAVGHSARSADPPKRTPPEKPTRWEIVLLIGAFAMGLCIDLLWVKESFLPLSLLWLVMSVMLVLTPGAFRRRNVIAYAALGTAALACISTLFFDCEWMRMLISIAVAPGLLMAAAVWAPMDREAEGERLFLLEYLLGWIIRPFAGVPRFLGVVRVLLPGKGNPTAMRIVVGLLISIPLLAVIIGLLMMADVYFSSALESALGAIRLSTALGHIFRVGVPLVLTFSFLVTYARKPFMEIAHPPKASWDRVILSTVLVALLAIYALFCGFQFFYLFGGHEAFVDGGYTYAEYARRGFSEMSLVCGINLFLFWLAVRFAKPAKSVSLLLGGLLLATVVMLVSAGLRLGLYIQAYGLTAQRVRAAWMIGVMAAIIIACGIKLLRPGLPIVRVAACIIMAAFLGLQFSMPDAMVARSNAARLKVQWNDETMHYMYTLSADAIPAMIDLYTQNPELADIVTGDREHSYYKSLRECLTESHRSLKHQIEDGRWISVSARHAYRMLDDLVQAGRL